MKKYTRATGGAPPLQDNLTEMEEKVVNIISSYSVVSCEDIIEPNMKFDFESSTTEKADNFSPHTEAHEDNIQVVNVSNP